MNNEQSDPHRGALTFRCFDLETTGTDVETCEVVQAAVVEASVIAGAIDIVGATAHSQLFAARDVPVEATRVHRITDRNPERFDFDVQVIPIDALPFGACVRSMVASLQEPDVVSVSFNGCGYDIPIVARHYAHAVRFSVRMSASEVAASLRARHIDVMRLWARARQDKVEAPWQRSLAEGAGCSGGWPHLTADMFGGSLTAAHGFWLGEGFDSAHDAAVDCHATLAVLHEMLRAGFVDVETAIRWSNQPLPGDVDFDGKFKWNGDQAVIGFGKHTNTPLERLPASYLQWMLGADFSENTKHVIRCYLAGEYPVREYEVESA